MSQYRTRTVNKQSPQVGVARLEIPRRFTRPPVPRCLGTRPSQAQNSRPDLNAFGFSHSGDGRCSREQAYPGYRRHTLHVHVNAQDLCKPHLDGLNVCRQLLDALGLLAQAIDDILWNAVGKRLQCEFNSPNNAFLPRAKVAPNS